LATLEIMQEAGAYEALERRSAMLAEGLLDAAAGAGVPVALNRVGSMLTPFFVRDPAQPVTNFTQATASDTAAYATFFHTMLAEGVYLAPSQYEAMFVGLAHTDQIIEQTIRAAEKSFEAVKRQSSNF
jgi:glutamate-1-semialdehyde 2,1-aminomutase